MQFVRKGPDIPDRLLQAHADGRVIFFCGAGISYPAGLPDFKGLVEQVFASLGVQMDEMEASAFKLAKYDTVLGLLEERVPGHRREVRKHLSKALQPKLRRKGATATHAALLRLATGRDSVVRLVTTNFDRVFEHVVKKSQVPVQSYAAPLLPIPKTNRWNGIVYLHGLLPTIDSEAALNSLVFTSGDFGLAYLTERWAARFVGDLFSNYTVCFVGYSVADPVMRYMMDALAADRIGTCQ